MAGDSRDGRGGSTLGRKDKGALSQTWAGGSEHAQLGSRPRQAVHMCPELFLAEVSLAQG